VTDERENFLARWSRRKHEAAEREAQAEQTPTSEPVPAERPEADDKEKFDPASLPALETIGPGTDIRAFLGQGVPAELTRAALRRAWSADPAIRDFVGLAENAWDFNAPDAVAGFGPIASEDVHKIMTQLLGDKTPPATSPETVCSAADTGQLPPGREDEPAGETSPDEETPQTLTLTQESTDAAQNEPDGNAANISMPRRQHGSALPE
jgi:hypothetical protein